MTITQQPSHPGLRIRIYTVDPQTLERTSDHAQVTIPASPTPMATCAWPPCLCPQCGGRPAFIGRRNAPPISPAG
jgi:hypothetical protein